MADLLAEGKSLEEAMRAVAAKAAKDSIASFTKSELSAHLGYEKRREKGERRGGREERILRAHRPNERRPDRRLHPARQGR